MNCERCARDHCEPMGLKLNFDYLDSNTILKIVTNLTNSGTYSLYTITSCFSSSPPRTYFAGFVEDSSVYSPYIPMKG